MGCGDACAIYPGKRDEDWQLDDPAGQSIEEVCWIRNDLDARVQKLLAGLVLRPLRQEHDGDGCDRSCHFRPSSSERLIAPPSIAAYISVSLMTSTACSAPPTEPSCLKRFAQPPLKTAQQPRSRAVSRSPSPTQTTEAPIFRGHSLDAPLRSCSLTPMLLSGRAAQPGVAAGQSLPAPRASETARRT